MTGTKHMPAGKEIGRGIHILPWLKLVFVGNSSYLPRWTFAECIGQ